MMAPRIRTLVLLLAATVVMAACGGPMGGSGPNPGGGAVPKGTYVVVGMTESGKARPVVPGTQIRFTFGDRQLLITAGCNTMSGPFRLERGRLSVGALASTAMGCPTGPAAQDAWLAGLFAGPVQLTFDAHGAVTRLTSGTTVLRVADRSTVSPDRPLIGTYWLLDTIIDKAAASTVPGGVTAWLRIDQTGRVGLYDGCNSASGPVVVGGSSVDWTARVGTQRGCFGNGVSMVEAAIGRVLHGGTTFTITEDRLTVTKGQQGLGFRAVAKPPGMR